MQCSNNALACSSVFILLVSTFCISTVRHSLFTNRWRNALQRKTAPLATKFTRHSMLNLACILALRGVLLIFTRVLHLYFVAQRFGDITSYIHSNRTRINAYECVFITCECKVLLILYFCVQTWTKLASLWAFRLHATSFEVTQTVANSGLGNFSVAHRKISTTKRRNQ